METQPTKNLVASSAPSLPWRTRISLSLLSTVLVASCRSNGTVNRFLSRLIEFRSPPKSNAPVNGLTSSDITVDASRNLWFRLYVPTDTARAESSLPVVVFFHGGGFVFLSADSKAYDGFCRRFAWKINAVVISVNYRLTPEHKYPAQYDDGFDVLKFVDDEMNARKILPENADLSSCFLAGDSAGANLAHHVAKRACETHFSNLKVIGVVAIQPFFGGEERTEAEIRLNEIDKLANTRLADWMWKAFLPPQEGTSRDHEAINVSGPRAVDISKLDFPAVLVVVGGFDSLQDWQRRYYEWLKKSGKEAFLVEYPTMVHGFYVFPEIPESSQIISHMKDFIHKQISKDEET